MDSHTPIYYNKQTQEGLRLEQGCWVPAEIASNERGDVILYDGRKWRTAYTSPTALHRITAAGSIFLEEWGGTFVFLTLLVLAIVNIRRLWKRIPPGLLRENARWVIVGASIVSAAIIFACATRFVHVGGGRVLDKWTGIVKRR